MVRTFVRVALVFDLHVGGRVIQTTAEHPFYVVGRGWVPAGHLQPGDWLVSHEGLVMPVERPGEAGKVTTVYFYCATFHSRRFCLGRLPGFGLRGGNPPVAACQW